MTVKDWFFTNLRAKFYEMNDLMTPKITFHCGGKIIGSYIRIEIGIAMKQYQKFRKKMVLILSKSMYNTTQNAFLPF